MIARLDHRPILMTTALATVLCALLLGVGLLFTGEPVQTLHSVNPSGISTNNSYGTGGASLNGRVSVEEINRTMSL
jgi:hypothetical protein